MKVLARSTRPLLVWALAAMAACSGNSEYDVAKGAAAIAGVATAADALANAYVPQVDPMTMSDEEIAAVLGTNAHCEFRYTRAGAPVFARGDSSAESVDAVVKLNGHLVTLHALDGPVSGPGKLVVVADPVRITVEPETPSTDSARSSSATMTFDIDGQLHVGYRGHYGCARVPMSHHSSPQQGL